MESFGQTIRKSRVAIGMLLREAAAELEIDPSLLSRIERGDKRATRGQVILLAKILDQREEEFLVQYLSDRVVYELEDEEFALKAVTLAERKLAYKMKGRKSKK